MRLPPPPPPPPEGRAFARFTRMRLPSSSWSLRPATAASASPLLPKVTKPKPRERPVSRSRITTDWRTTIQLSEKGLSPPLRGRRRKIAYIKDLTELAECLTMGIFKFARQDQQIRQQITERTLQTRSRHNQCERIY